MPALFLGFLISSLFGALFHLWKDGGPGRLLLYLILSWMGFGAGHFLGGLIDFSFLSYGELNLGAALTGGVLFLGVGYWLSLVKPLPGNK